MDVTTLIFLGLAVFVIWRLWAVLGQRPDSPPFDPRARRDAPPSGPAPGAPNGNVIPLPGARAPETPRAPANDPERWRGVADAGSALARGLDAVAAADPSFNAESFSQGARAAYEMIVTSFSRGDRATLKNLLSKDVFEGFSAAIADRESKKHTAETTFVSIDEAKIVEAELKDRQAQATVRFVSKIISVTRDAAGAVVDGAGDKIVEVTDIWTFARDVRARDPNWVLIATEAGA
ncbi:Tim44/TimA family putative adaptor protein [Terrarubrum flagellatum]|uniref:Tim44/TimA family putative adaptor protein n=1 Tax=Terrirubrum flagellatum TaxID=2895980 RepID=UPI0031453541